MGHETPFLTKPVFSIREGEYLIGRVYNAIRSNPKLWASTLFILLYDEHGGFFDHVSPTKAVPPDKYVDEFSFNQYGVRVPAILISPWAPQGFTDVEFDHTSVLKYLIEKWGLRPDQLGERVEQSQSFADSLNEISQPRLDALPAFDLSSLSLPRPVVPQTTNEHQDALVSFSHLLEQRMAHVEELSGAGYRSLKSLEGVAAQMEVAKDRFLLFLHHGQGDRL